MRITITGNTRKTLEWTPGETLLEGLHKAGVYVNAACGGSGRCGKCRVRVVSGQLAVTAEDKAIFSEEELAAGWRLACRAVPAGDCVIALYQDDEDSFLVESHFEGEQRGGQEPAGKEAAGRQETQTKYFFAIDIGTTTIAVGLAEADTGRLADVHTSVNHQRAWGADVIARIQAAVGGQGDALRRSIQHDLVTAMNILMKKHGLEEKQITKVVIAGNTTMGHLLMGYDCSGLGVVPFTPVNINTIRGLSREILGGRRSDIPVVLIPGVSAYVGGDIVSGLYHCGFDRREKPSLFLDLGTNGEMALGNQDKLLVTSTAAGPAFEGGNISCGMGSVAGAISGVTIDGGRVSFATIGGNPPVGLCGTGVIETAAELVKADLVDETGLLDDDYFDDGFLIARGPDGSEISFTQKDVREIQLAKAAVRAGLETLLARFGVGYDDLEDVLVAGGFGVKLDMKKAAVLGLLPEELLPKVKAVGNTSLAGAVDYGVHKDGDGICHSLIGRAEEIDLSTDKDFKEFYMDYMMFE